jgi:hypothetical protein
MAKSSDRKIAELVHSGKTLADSDRWQLPLAKVTGVSQTLLAMIARGERSLTPAVEKKIGAGLIKTSVKMAGRAVRLREIGERFLKRS